MTSDGDPLITPRAPFVSIYTFGYQRSGPPSNAHGNGGGFVFDCRFLENPGLRPGMMLLTGKDMEIIRLLEADADAAAFLNDVYSIVKRAILSYAEKGYDRLMVSFGCTGGQHRSVYCAERLASYLEQAGVEHELVHTEREYWP